MNIFKRIFRLIRKPLRQAGKSIEHIIKGLGGDLGKTIVNELVKIFLKDRESPYYVTRDVRERMREMRHQI